MELTKKELGYLELYKGLPEGLKYIKPELDESIGWFYQLNYSNNTINCFLNFIFTKDANLLKDVDISDLNDTLDMIFTISDVACRYALENPDINYRLFRYEHINNMDNYGRGNMTFSFKSTSRSDSESTVFNYPNTKGICIDTINYVPYIDVDHIVRSSPLSDEKEFLFPPCIKSMTTGQVDHLHGKDYENVVLIDYFNENYDTDGRAAVDSVEHDFVSELFKCKSNKEVSDRMISYCDIVGKHIYNTLRNMYHNYAMEYINKHIHAGSQSHM